MRLFFLSFVRVTLRTHPSKEMPNCIEGRPALLPHYAGIIDQGPVYYGHIGHAPADSDFAGRHVHKDARISTQCLLGACQILRLSSSAGITANTRKRMSVRRRLIYHVMLRASSPIGDSNRICKCCSFLISISSIIISNEGTSNINTMQLYTEFRITAVAH